MKRTLQLTAILILTAFLVWIFLRNANLHDVGRILAGVSVAWLAAAVSINLCTLLFRTWRWRMLLDPKTPPSFYATFFANAVGYMLSTVLPIRAADVARPVLLSRRSNHRVSGALGTVLMERMLDLASILTLYIYFVVRRWNEYTHNPATAEVWNYLIKPSGIVCGVLLVALLSFTVGVLFFASTLRRLHYWLARFVPKRFRDAWMHFFDTFVQTVQIVRDAPTFAKILVCTVGVWACLTVQFIFSVKALHMVLPFDSSFFITGTTTVGLAIPTPGGIGGLHKICQFDLTRFYGVGVDQAVAAAVLFHLVGSVPVVVVGLALFIHEGLRWKDVPRA